MSSHIRAKIKALQHRYHMPFQSMVCDVESYGLPQVQAPEHSAASGSVLDMACQAVKLSRKYEPELERAISRSAENAGDI